MTGAKLGDRLLQIGCTDPSLVAAIGSKVGMSGRACVIVNSEEHAASARRGGERAGVLLEVEQAPPGSSPYDNDSFDLIVIDNQDGLIANMKPEQRVATLRDAKRLLAPRGRIVIIERAPRAGLGALFSRATAPADPHYGNTGGAMTALQAEGFKAVRQLAEREGLSFFEGIA
jgi:SAM-dependent methyltransferase